MGESIANLKAGCQALNLSLSEAQLMQIEGYLDQLTKWNRAFNLTAIKERSKMLTHHVFDSLAVAPFLAEGEHFLDVGTGAGLPGMMLAIVYPHKSFTLLDSNSKKTSFIKQTAHLLKINNVNVVTSRIEDFQPSELFDAVISRAFASLKDFVTLTERLAKSQGKLLAMKGPKVFEEVQDFSYDKHIEKITVPFLDEERYIVKVMK